ncbi:MAG: glycoside hydrolase family 9 protein, partial [Bacteroidales bacterium]|nr:glycoside hydrolase family 9 protein [Bacteroidales bacterium]
LTLTFSDGKHISFAPQKFYSDNIPGNEDDNVTEAVMDPWENFLGAATLLYAMERIDGLTEEKREEMLQSATHIFTTALASRDNWEEPRMKEAAWGAIAATKLFKATSEQRYSRVAEHFGVKLLSFQQREAVRTADGTAIMGWFNDRQISGDINYSHSAAFESPLLAISILCEAFPESPLQMEWHAAAALYIDYLKKTTAILADKAPYGHLAHRILPTGKIPAEFGNSTAINDTLSLRSFPVWKSQMQHGENTCNLSQAWALAEAATLLGDREAMEMAGRQLEWVIGCNPFTQSLMYGVGNNFPNLYTLCTQNAVGALPVGIDSMHDDLPYWQSSAYACFKEIWVEPSSRFLGTLALYLKFMENQR